MLQKILIYFIQKIAWLIHRQPSCHPDLLISIRRNLTYIQFQKLTNITVYARKFFDILRKYDRNPMKRSFQTRTINDKVFEYVNSASFKCAHRSANYRTAQQIYRSLEPIFFSVILWSLRFTFHRKIAFSIFDQSSAWKMKM